MVSRGWRLLVVGVLIFGSMCAAVPGQAAELSAAEVNRLQKGFDGRGLPPRPKDSVRSLAAYEALAKAVPVILDENGLSSGYVVGATGNSLLIITNEHAVRKPFMVGGKPTVLAVFYDTELMRAVFSVDRARQCPSTKGAWCEAFDKSVRRAEVLATDRTRDLALLSVTEAPAGVRPLVNAAPEAVIPLMTVTVVGHPERFVWTVTPGTVTKPIQKIAWRPGSEIEMVQTAASIHHGNSGGPMLTLDGKVIGVVAGGPGETLNLAVAISEVGRFLKENEAKTKLK